MGGHFQIYRRNDEAYWLDDLDPLENATQFAHESPYDVDDGPE